MTPSAHLSSRFYAWLLSVPVFMKVVGIALGMALVLGAGMLWQIHRTWHAHLVRELELRGQKLAAEVGARCTELSRSAPSADIPAELSRSLAESADVVYLAFLDTNGTVLAEARRSPGPARGDEVRELAAPISSGPYRLLVGISTSRIDSEVGWLTRRLAFMTAIIALLGMTAAWRLSRIFAHPIEELVQLTRAVKAGNYQIQASVRADDEVGELAAAFNEMTSALAQKEAARQQLLRQVIGAAEDERKRIARELHDHTGQALTSLIASLSALENQAAEGALRQRLVDLRLQIEQTLTEVHDLSVALRPSVLDDIGLMAALQRHCRLVAQRFNIEVSCAEIGLDGGRLPAELELTVYRVVQESLTNAVRHGKASRVSALVHRHPARVQTTIQDNGVGFDARDWQQRCIEGNHLGLLGIEERVQLLGGSFCIESEPGRGATVYADIPLPAPL